jgi:two-component system, NtrC family, response regulator HydG
VIEVSTLGKLLIVDDELTVRDSLGKWFREEGYDVTTLENAGDALTQLATQRWDVALVDIKMHGTDGIELQRRMHEIDPELLVIIMTGYASVETAVAALKNGAYDYVTKPLDPDEIAHLVKNALAHRRTTQENVLLRETVAEVARPEDMVGQSGPMRKVFEAVETVGPTDATVLITGESGTGKELVARAIHQASVRRFHPLVAIHCGALTETLLESELFGHEKGAFTGAQFRKKGKFEIAEGGTIFLDEIGDISLKTQTDLLRVLQEREITRVGGNQTIKVDFRCIAATNKDLEKLIEEGKFRPDLFYRLNVFRIELPPLRERRDDIPALVNHFVRKFSLSNEQTHHSRCTRGHEPVAGAALGGQRSRTGKRGGARHGCRTGTGIEGTGLHLQIPSRQPTAPARPSRTWSVLTSCAWSKSAAAIRATPRRCSTSTGSLSITSSKSTAGRGLRLRRDDGSGVLRFF